MKWSINLCSVLRSSSDNTSIQNLNFCRLNTFKYSRVESNHHLTTDYCGKHLIELYESCYV